VWRERNFCHRFQDGRGCGPLCPRIHGAQPVFDVHTYLLNKAREDPVWRLAIIEVARALAVPTLAIHDVSSDSSEELPPPAPGYPQHGKSFAQHTGGLIPTVPPKVYPCVPKFFDISGDSGSAQGLGQASQDTSNRYPWETATPSVNPGTVAVVKAIPKSTIQPKLQPPPLPAHIRVPPMHYANAAGTNGAAEEDTDFHC
jgi:hypothetical protein